MPYRRFRRRIGEFFRRDWLEILVTAFGVLILVLGVACIYGVVYLVVTFDDHKLFQDVSPTSQKVLSIAGIFILGMLAMASLAGGWGLVGKRVARSLARRRDRST